MYLEHFGLNQQPFSMTPDPGFFFAGNRRGEILDALIYAVSQGDGIVKVTGEVGCGKTMLCRMLESRLPGKVEAIYLINPTLTREQVIFTIAGELELAIDGKRVDEVIRMLHAELINKHIQGKQVVLLIEEAQAMSLDTLEEIRLFSNLETAHHKLLQIVLFGQPELDEHLNVPIIRQLKERISNSFKVPPLNQEAVEAYLMFRLRAAGYRGPPLFSKKAVQLISKVSKGIIRRIGILADKALLAAYAESAYSVEVRHAKAAITDSEFPMPFWLPLQLNFRSSYAMACALLMAGLIGSGWYLSTMWAAKPAMAKAMPQKAVAAVATHARAALIFPLAEPQAPALEGATQPEPEKVATVSEAMPAEPVEVKIVASNPASASVQEMLQRTEVWLNEQARTQFSVQIALINAGDRAELNRYLKKLESEANLNDVHVYSSAKDPRYGIVMGSYANRNDAVKVIDTLQSQWGYHAQLRTIGGIMREIGKT